MHLSTKNMRTLTLCLICISFSQVLCISPSKKSRAEPLTSNMNYPLEYDIVLSGQTLRNIVSYKKKLANGTATPGLYLSEKLSASLHSRNFCSLERMPNDKFIDLLLSTKKALIFAESSIKSDGKDWNDMELKLLGDVNVAMRVKIYDNGEWDINKPRFHTHDTPMDGTLLFTPGPLLERGIMERNTPDLDEILEGQSISQTKYNNMIERRLAPLLYYANKDAGFRSKKALVTIPGVGCGVFAGDYIGQMGEHLNRALRYILSKHMTNLNNIACVHFDPHYECRKEETNFRNIKYRIRPLKLPLLSKPIEFQEDGDDFSNCLVYKVVAWDHVSFPGNDFFHGSRYTDDGVSAAATNSMKVITGVTGRYNGRSYKPPSGKSIWLNVVKATNTRLRAENSNIKVLVNGILLDLMDHQVVAYCNEPNPEL